jgi:hypothetical protein
LKESGQHDELPGSTMSYRAALDTATALPRICHVGMWICGVHTHAVPTTGKRQFRSEAVLTQPKASREAIGKDFVIATVRLMAAPADAGKVVVVGAPFRRAGKHAEVSWKASDVGPPVAIAEPVVQL